MKKIFRSRNSAIPRTKDTNPFKLHFHFIRIGHKFPLTMTTTTSLPPTCGRDALSALRTSDRVSVPGPKGGLQRAVITGITGSASRQQVKVKCANGDEGILRQLVGTEVAVNVGGNAFVTKPEEVCGGLVQFRDVASKAVHDAVGEPDTDSSMSVVDDGEYAFENWEEEYTKAHRLM